MVDSAHGGIDRKLYYPSGIITVSPHPPPSGDHSGGSRPPLAFGSYDQRSRPKKAGMPSCSNVNSERITSCLLTFEAPARRLTNTIGVSPTRQPTRRQR